MQLESFWMALGTEDGKVLGTTNREIKDLNGRLLLVSNDEYCNSEEYKKDIKNHSKKDESEEDDDDNNGDNGDNREKDNNKSSGDDKNDRDHSSIKEIFEDAIITTSEDDSEGKKCL